MDRTITADIDAPATRAIDALADLATYPEWLPIVSAVTAAEADVVDPRSPENDAPAFVVTLRAKLGPFARSKRLRMVQTHRDGRSVRFERKELDGRDHAAWTLEATADDIADGRQSRVTVQLHYGGSLWSSSIEAALDASEGTAVDRLNARLAD